MEDWPFLGLDRAKLEPFKINYIDLGAFRAFPSLFSPSFSSSFIIVVVISSDPLARMLDIEMESNIFAHLRAGGRPRL